LREEIFLDERDDGQLVTASRTGDRGAYAALVRRHGKRVFAICLGILGNVADSEDAAQEALVKGMTQLHTLRDDGQFGGWIARIARNLCLNLLRNKTRRRDLLAAQGTEEATEAPDFSHLHAALARLPEKYRLPLVLFYFDGKDTLKLAQELNMSRAGACTRLSRARRELRRELSKQVEVP
jgi:RNA polymerase sigma-70 factor (ECF subfamily)